MTLIMPCSAFDPYNDVAEPLTTSIWLATSVCASKSSFTLQKPAERNGIPSSAVKMAPHEPAPVNTGERMEGKYS